jgi:hypothetical protein
MGGAHLLSWLARALFIGSVRRVRLTKIGLDDKDRTILRIAVGVEQDPALFCLSLP